MESFLGHRKNEMYLGYEKENMSFEEFIEVVDEYIYYTTKEFNPKQNGCLLLFTEKHHYVKLNSNLHMSKILVTYHFHSLLFFL